MAVEIVKLMQGVLTIRVTRELSQRDIDQLQLATKQAIGQWIKIRVLMILDHFDGWEPEHLANGAGFLMVGDANAIDKVAVVGDRRHEDGTRVYLGKNLPNIAIHYFPSADHDDAVNWIVDGL
jgi:hypothetical protein